MSSNTIYIPSRGRPQCLTAQYLKRVEYPGDWTILITPDDPQLNEYKDRWGGNLTIFDKQPFIDNSDFMDAYEETLPTGVMPARNACLQIAKERGLKRFWMWDDDYVEIVMAKSDGAREILLDGKRLFEELDKLETFALKAGIQVVGFGTNTFKNAREGVRTAGTQVYNGVNISVDSIGYTGRLFEDGVHTYRSACLGRPDFCFYHLYIVTKPYFLIGNAKGHKYQGGLADTYEAMTNTEKVTETNMVRHVGYILMAAPLGIKLLCGKPGIDIDVYGELSKRGSIAKLIPKYISEKHCHG